MSNTNASRGLDLASLFGAASQALVSHQSSLNQADTENQNHGDNMVQIFNLITQAVQSQSGASPSQQLNHASQSVAQHATSGSAQAYSQGLAHAAQQLQGQQSLTSDNAMTLIQSLLSGGQLTQSQGGADLLGALMGGEQSTAPQGGDLLGALMGGAQSSAPQEGAELLGALLGGGQTSQQDSGQQNGLDMGDLLNAGMAFMNAKQQGQGTLQAGLAALMAAGPLGQKPHRQQSGQLVANALMQAISGMSKR